MKKTIILLAACLIALLCAGWALAEEGVLTLPEGLTRVEEEAFYGVKGARSAVVPQGVTEIGDRAFAESGFTEIRLPATVTAIGDGAFRNCGRTWEKARYYFLPNGVNANASALEGCKADVYFDGQKLPYFQYTVADGGVTIMGMNGQLTEVVIPDTIEGKPVVAIGDNTFSGKSAMTGVTIPATVTSIGSYAFSNCSALTAIDLPAGLTSLGNGAFYFCQSLTGIDLPAGITALPQETFYGCRALAEIDLTGITSLGKSVFRECRALTEVIIPASITSLPESAFEEAQGLTQVHLPNTLTEINEFAFYGCRALTQIQIPSGITAIPQGVLQNCSALQSVQLPAGVVTIGQNAFRSCTVLTDINFPEGLTAIGQEAFRDTCVGQGENAIYALPESVDLDAMGSSAFYNCGAGLLVAPGSGMEDFVKANGYTFAYDANDGFRYQYKKSGDVYTLYLTGYKGQGGNVVIPAGPGAIGESAFKDNAALTGVTIPDGVTLIDRCAFQNCSNLASVTMADSVVTIGDNAFRSCAALTDVTFPANLQSIGSDAFNGACTVEGVHYYKLPDHVTAFGGNAFKPCGAVLCFNRGSDTATLFQQNQYIYTYTGETDFRYRWYNNEGTEGHQERLLQYVGSDATVEIPAHIWLIDDNAFKDNTTLTKVVVPEGVTTIGNNVFQGCVNLTDITLPDSLTLLKDNVFRGCGSNSGSPFLFYLPDDIGEVWANVFTDCPAILICGLETTTAAWISNRGWSFVRSDRAEELDIRYKYSYFDNNVWLWGLYDYVGDQTSVRLPDDCTRVCSDNRLQQKVKNGLELVCAQLSDTAAALSRAEINFTFPGHEGLRYRIMKDNQNHDVLYIMGYAGSGNEIIIPAATAYIGAGWDEQIRAGAFLNRQNITKVVVPEGVTCLNDDAFSGCVNLTDITLPDSLKSFGTKVFRYAGQGLAEPFRLVLPDHMEDLWGRGGGANSFEDLNAVLVCGKTSDTAALLSDKNYCYTVAGEYDFRYRYETYPSGSEAGRQLWLVGYEGTGTTANIPEGIYGIRRFNANTTDSNWPTFHGDAFYGNETVTKVVIPEGTVDIRSDVFTNCYNLTDITFPSTLKKLDQNVFIWCGRNAQEPFYFVLPDGLETMTWRDGGATTFLDCNAVLVCGKTSQTAALLTYSRYVYTCPGEYDFRYRYEEYTENGETRRRLWLVGYTGENAEVTIPAGIYGIKRYSSNTGSNYWRTFYGDAFYGNNTVTRVVIPEGTVAIDEWAFFGCSNLTDITFPSTLKKIALRSFQQCGSASDTVHYYVLPDDMEEIGTGVWGAFNDINKGVLVCSWDSNTALLLSDSYDFALTGHQTDGLLYRYYRYDTQIPEQYDYRLVLKRYIGSGTEITIPSGIGLYRIENDVFKDRNTIEMVVIPSGVVEIGSGAFDGCTLLHCGEEEDAIILPSGVKKIGDMAFHEMGFGYTAERFFLVLPSSVEEMNINAILDTGAVLVAPDGSYAAQVLYQGWYFYYPTLADARAKTKLRYRPYIVDGVEMPIEMHHYGNR